MLNPESRAPAIVETDIPARLDRLPWGRFHTLVVVALAIAFFQAVGTGTGGVAGPWLFGLLIDSGSRWSVYGGYLFGAVLMLAAAAVAARCGVAAVRKPLEAVCRPLAAVD